jgi:elongation factor Ts
MTIDMETITKLRGLTGAGVVDCKNALTESDGDIEKAAEILRKKGIAKADKKGERVTEQGVIHSYIHAGGQVGVLIEVLCETDFVARNEQFQEFVHDLALQIAAANPLYVAKENVPQEMLEKERSLIAEEFAGSGKSQDMIDKIVDGKLDKYLSEMCLMNQRFVKDEDLTIEEFVKAKIGTIGENIKVKRFTRYALGEVV